MVDLIEDNFNGLLIPTADSNALANAIWKLSQNPQLRAKLGRAAQDTMRRFTWTRTVESVENACAQALRRVGRESDIQSEAPMTDSKFTAIEHS
jgi:glycosyltransferase involved in cell wall biosynthesis